MRSLLQNRWIRTTVLFAAGLLAAWIVAWISVPRWPDFCDGTIVGASCEGIDYLVGFGYATIVLGILTMILGPVTGSLIDLAINGANWETPRGTETVTTNMPLLLGAIYMAVGLVVVIIGQR